MKLQNIKKQKNGGAFIMNKLLTEVKIKEQQGAFYNQRKCGYITCIHCINERCTSDKCDMFEREYVQEG